MPKVGQPLQPLPSKIQRATKRPISNTQPSPSAWVTQGITVITAGEQRRRTIGLSYGQLAVHQAVDTTGPARGRWVVTSLTTGLQLTNVCTEVDAKRIAAFLWRRACLALREPTRSRVLARLPPWVKLWCLACRDAGKYLDPEPYVQSKA